MGRSKASGPSISSLWREYFRNRPELLKAKNNDEVYALFKKDHPDIELTKKVTQVCANVKSTERNRAKKLAKEAKVASGVKPGPKPGRASAAAAVQDLEGLEDQIHACIAAAKRYGRDGLDEVAKHLRRALGALAMKLE
jgi:hypothetical protein